MPDLPDRLAAVYDSLVSDGPLSVEELADRYGVSKGAARTYASRLRQHGVDVVVDDGAYDIPWPDSVDDDSSDADADDDAPDTDDDSKEIPRLDDQQRTVITALPASLDELAGVLDDTDPHVALDLLRSDGIEVRYDPDAGKYYLADDRSDKIRQQSHLSLSAKTKRAKQALREEQAIINRLPDTTPLAIAPENEPDPGTETMVAGIGDLHFGDEVTNDRGVVTWNNELADKAVDRFAEKVVKHKRQWPQRFDELVLPILGDIATGTQIYETQRNDIEELLAGQIRDGSQALTRLVSTLAEHFKSVRVYAVVGNHGFQDPSAARGSNTDLACYYWMQDALRREGYDNVEITLGEHTHHLNFDVRGWRMHIRHGQDSQQQVDETARSEADWRGWRDKHKFDLAMRGHHHVPSLHWVLNRYPVVSLPSPKPGGEFADRIGDPDASTPAEKVEERKVGYVFGVSEDRRITDSRMTDAG